jgi:CRISPR-associated protein (TIGR02710 family)
MAKGLVLSVGMSVESEVHAIKTIEPDWVAFVCTPGSLQKLDMIVEGTGLQLSQFKTFEVADDPSQVGDLVSQAHVAYRWVREKVGEEGEIIVNPTAGRKWMSTGMTLFAGQTAAKIVYVDVDFDGGKPVPDTMRIVDLGNPDDATGMMKSEEPVALFNRYDFEGAATAFGRIKPSRSAPLRLYRALATVSGLLAKWDRFEHYTNNQVSEKLREAADEVRQAASELRMLAVDKWGEAMSALAGQIDKVTQSEKPSLEAVADLLANARRKMGADRYDDAGARLYRALEATAQWMLTQKGINSADVKWDSISDEAQRAFEDNRSGQARNDWPSKLGLTDSFALAKALKCNGADEFFEGNRFKLSKQIQVRNQSILAHGWVPVRKETAESLSNAVAAALSRLKIEQNGWDVPKLPRLWQ